MICKFRSNTNAKQIDEYSFDPCGTRGHWFTSYLRAPVPFSAIITQILLDANNGHGHHSPDPARTHPLRDA